MQRHIAPTHCVQIFVAGPMDRIQHACAEYCLEVGLCVSVDATDFIYTGGREAGAVIRLVNYPRFPASPEQIDNHAAQLAERLIVACSQHSALIVGPVESVWITRRPESVASKS